MEKNKSTWAQLYQKEDWLACWLGFIIIALASIAVITQSFDISIAKFSTYYMQACYAYVNGEAITNNNIRNLFDIDSADKYKASRIIKESLEAGVIKPIQPNMAPRHRKYIPIWA